MKNEKILWLVPTARKNRRAAPANPLPIITMELNYRPLSREDTEQLSNGGFTTWWVYYVVGLLRGGFTTWWIYYVVDLLRGMRLWSR
jgi:hypothetical protein